jgi:DNA-binding transcriptional regulator YhcF (GntR family)
MRLRISRRSDVSIREQLTTQIVLAITSNELKPEEKLPSTRTLARRLQIHANTVSAAYRDLVTRGWLELRKGSGVYVRDLDPGHAPEDRGHELDRLIRDFTETARGKGFSATQIHERLRHWLELQPPDHFLVIDDDVELRRILVHEVSGCTRFPVRGVSVEACRDGTVLEGAAALALYGRSDELKELLPPDRTCLWLRTRSVEDELQSALRPIPAGMSVAVVSHWPDFLRWARTILLAAGVDRDALSFHDARENDWEAGLKAADIVLVDAFTEARLPAREHRHRSHVFVFSLLPEASRKQLREHSRDFTRR